jgi:hypothetical protein
MAICDIKNKLIRRAIISISIVPVTIVIVIVTMVVEAYKISSECIEVYKSLW